MTRVKAELVRSLCEAAVTMAGAAPHHAQVLAEATTAAELRGNRSLGVSHLFDYLDALHRGRLDGMARATITRQSEGIVVADASGGLAQSAFRQAMPEFVDAVRALGLAGLWIRNSFTCGELGFYVEVLARQGIAAIAGANSPALMSLGGSAVPVLGTNPIAFGVPSAEHRSGLVFDQATSETAYVKVKQAAAAGLPISDGWAVDEQGAATTDATRAVRGALLPFGGYKGGNLALMVEIITAAAGGNWSLEAPPFDSGGDSPAVGMFVLGIDLKRLDPTFEARLQDHLTTLREEHAVWLPFMAAGGSSDWVEIDKELLDRLRSAARSS